ncbi:MAG: acetate kinase [Desulfobacterales bacterium]
MIILIINAGSSSVKFSLFDMQNQERLLARGMVERIGSDDSRFVWMNTTGKEFCIPAFAADTRTALHLITECIVREKLLGANSFIEQIAAIGHRVVHGGERIRDAVVIDATTKVTIQTCYPLAPLHNPPNLKGIEACEEFFPGVPQVAVFDTAFHATIPPRAFLYGLPYRIYQSDKVRRYGFHGTSHNYVCQRAADLLARPLDQLKIVSCHLGNGCSITAVDGGKSVDTSMGMTPLEGLIMGTRSGDLDPAIIFYLIKNKRLKIEEVDDLLNKKSGLLGLAEIESGDVRDIEAAAKNGNGKALTALDVFSYRAKKYIGAYAFAMGGIDAIVFTAGIGENSPLIRQMICDGLHAFGIELDSEKNSVASTKAREVQSDRSRVKVIVAPTKEERAIARETFNLLATST